MRDFFRRRKYFFIPLIILAIVVFGCVTMGLWNYLMPVIFKLPEITFWQAICLLILSRILFSGGPRGHMHHQRRWAGNFRDKISKMTSEEREAFFQKWHSGCRPGNFRKEDFIKQEEQ